MSSAVESRPDFYIRGLCLAVICGAFVLSLRLVWQDCPVLVLQLLAGFGFLAAMAVFIRPYGISASALTPGQRYAGSAVAVAAYASLGLLLLSSSAPSRLHAYAGTIFACGMVLLGVNGWKTRCSDARRRLGDLQIVGCGVTVTILLTLGSLLPSQLFQAIVWAALIGAQLLSWREPAR